MTLCACGCKQPVEGRMAYKPNHRQRAYRRRLKAEMQAGGFPASPSLGAVRATRTTSSRNGDAPRPRNGLQVSYRKAVEQVAMLVRAAGIEPETAHEISEAAMQHALSPRQREILRERQAA